MDLSWVSDADCETAAGKGRFDLHDSEHLHAITGDCVFLVVDSNVPEAQSFNKGSDHFMVGNHFVRCSGLGRGHKSKLLARKFRPSYEIRVHSLNYNTLLLGVLPFWHNYKDFRHDLADI